MAIKITTTELKHTPGKYAGCIRFGLIKQNAVSSDDIAASIEKETGIPAIEVMTVLRSFYWRASEELLNGKAVDIQEFGTLHPVVKGTKETAPELKVIFRAKGDFKKCLSKVEFKEVVE